MSTINTLLKKPDPKTGIREQNKLATRNLLIKAGTNLFASKGYDAVTLDDVAEEASVHVQTLYKHFKNKHSLALALFEDSNSYMLSKLDEIMPEEDCYFAWKARVLELMGAFTTNKMALKIFKMIFKHQELLVYSRQGSKSIEDKLTEKLLQQKNRKNKSPEGARMLAAMMVSAYMDAHINWIESNGKIKSSDTLEKFCDFIESKNLHKI